MNNSIILFGGTFNPLHNGHMIIAIKLYSLFQHPITFLPTGIPPYKAAPLTTATDRLNMLNLALEHDNRFLINTSEIDKDEFCYTYNTLSIIRNEVGHATPVFFIIGSDSLVSLDTWDNWKLLLELTNFIVIKRQNYNESLMANELITEFTKRKTNDLTNFKASNHGQFFVVDFEPIDISSTQIRNMVTEHQSIENLVPSKIATYINNQQLYARHQGNK